VVIFDVETNGIARKLRGHVRQVQSLSWSANDRYLLSASQDWKAILWDLQDGSRVRSIQFEAPIFIADLHPRNHLMFVVALFDEQPMLVDITQPEAEKHVLSSAPFRTQSERETATEKQAAQDAKQTTTVALFSPSGNHIITGTNKGWVNIIDTETKQTVSSTRLTTSIIILLRITASGRDMLVNASDRILRTLHLPNFDDPNLDFENLELEVEHKFQDLVQRLSWNHVSFAPEGEYVIATPYMHHDIYVWETGSGTLFKILEGPKDELSVTEWHPHKPFVAAVGVDTGRVYLWSILTPQRWSALAPDFVEVEENVEYVEREDEFDIQPIEEIHKRRLDQEDEDVDVLTIEPVKGAEWTEPGDFRMPVLLDIDNNDSEDEVVAIGAGQFRRKNAGQDWEDGDVTGSGDDTKKQVTNGNGRVQNGAKRRRGE